MSESSFVRQRFADPDNMLLLLNDNDAEAHDEFKPLAPTCPQNVRTKLAIKKAKITAARDDEDITCFGDLWRLVASAALSLLLILPFLYSLYQYKQLSSELQDLPIYPSDLLQCADDYNISFALLHRQIELSSDYCDTAHGASTTTTCTCTDPLEPIAHVPSSSPLYIPKWDDTFERNKLLAAAADSPRLVLYGDSITEHWVGTDFGEMTQETMSVKKQFDSIFEEGQAVALGLAGDRCPQLLYRLQQGELPISLDPPVIWLLIGTNDQADHCSQESILVGIMNIAQYLQEQRPNARLVINGILPKPNPTSREWKDTKYYASVTWINQLLACYAEGLEGVEYFDPSFLFIDEEGLVPEDLIPDGIHPSGKGSRIWGEAILKRVEEIVEEQAGL